MKQFRVILNWVSIDPIPIYNPDFNNPKFRQRFFIGKSERYGFEFEFIIIGFSFERFSLSKGYMILDLDFMREL